MHHEVSRVEGVPWLRLGQLWETDHQPIEFQSTLSTLFWEYASMCTLTSRVQASLNPPVNITGAPCRIGDCFFWCWTSGLGYLMCGSNCSLPEEDLCSCNFPSLLNLFPEADVWTRFLPFSSYLIPYVIFLQPCLYRSFSARLQLAFTEICSTCNYIFGAFLTEGEFLILLLHHIHHLTLHFNHAFPVS